MTWKMKASSAFRGARGGSVAGAGLAGIDTASWLGTATSGWVGIEASRAVINGRSTTVGGLGGAVIGMSAPLEPLGAWTAIGIWSLAAMPFVTGDPNATRGGAGGNGAWSKGGGGVGNVPPRSLSGWGTRWPSAHEARRNQGTE